MTPQCQWWAVVPNVPIGELRGMRRVDRRCGGANGRVRFTDGFGWREWLCGRRAPGDAAGVAGAAWNGTGQLTAYSDAAANMTAATYNGNGERATFTTSAVTQGFVWNTVSQIPQVIMDSDNAYIYCSGPAPAEQVNLSTGTITYLVTDSLGSVRGTVNSSGTLIGTTSYDAWGNPETTGGLTATTPFGYAGGYTDPTGLIYLINRYYDSATGQFISVDPMIIQTLQPYAYASDDPVNATDPTGAWKLVWQRLLWIPYAFKVYFTEYFTAALAAQGKRPLVKFFVSLYGVLQQWLPPEVADWIFDHIFLGAAEAIALAHVSIHVPVRDVVIGVPGVMRDPGWSVGRVMLLRPGRLRMIMACGRSARSCPGLRFVCCP